MLSVWGLARAAGSDRWLFLLSGVEVPHSDFTLRNRRRVPAVDGEIQTVLCTETGDFVSRRVCTLHTRGSVSIVVASVFPC